MGGHAAGEVASEIAVQTLAAQAPRHPDAEALGKAVEGANVAVLQATEQNPALEGMGTTMTAAMLEGSKLVIAQVGDSRAYLLSNGSLQQITRDHSLMADLIEAGQITEAQARTHPQRSVITRALGTSPYTQPDLYEISVEAGDRLLLCSDGLSSMVERTDISQTLSRVHDPQRCAAQLVNQAIAAGGHDNITVIVADVEGGAEKRQKKATRKSRLSVALVLVLLIGIFTATAFGVSSWLGNSAYLAEQDGMVAIYKGVRGNFLGMDFSHVESVTDVPVSSLNPGLAERLQNQGVTVDSLEAAYTLVDEYRAEIAESQGTQSGNTTSETNTTATNTSDAANNTQKADA